MKLVLALAALACTFIAARAQTSLPAPVTFTAEQDHANMMEQLGIRALRQGPSGDDKAPNHANYDEALANPYPVLPDPLLLNNGKRVTTAAQWIQQRRPELVELFSREIYGRVPAHTPAVTWKETAHEVRQMGATQVDVSHLLGHVDDTAYPAIPVEIAMTLVLPTGLAHPAPILLMFRRSELPAAPTLVDQQIVASGWGFVALEPASIQADNGAGLTRGIIGLVNHGQPRKPDDWGALRAWSWGAGRALDYLQHELHVDGAHVAIEGVSRFGKAALVTLAFDQRFYAGLIGSSGEGGAKLHRRNFGEAVESLTGGEYYWMAGNFLKYGASDAATGPRNAGDLPVDSHELIALCAPRLTFISYGSPAAGDARWLDQQGSYMATVAAQPVFTLLHAPALGVTEPYLQAHMPPIQQGLLTGRLAWRQHEGGHTDAPNIPYFLTWANDWIARDRASHRPGRPQSITGISPPDAARSPHRDPAHRARPADRTG